MNIDTMRNVDYWAGRPLCLVLSVIRSLACLFAKPAVHGAPVKKVLFIKPSEMGGIILSYSLIKHVGERYPEAELYFLTFEENRCLFDVLPMIHQHNIFTIRATSLGTFLADTTRVIKRLRALKLDTVFDLEFFSRYTAILCDLTGASRRVGYHRYGFEGLFRGNLLTHHVIYNPFVHVSESYLSMAQALENKEKKSPELVPGPRDAQTTLPLFEPSEKLRESIQDRLSGTGVPEKALLFLINPGEGKIPLREWPLESFAQLARYILKDRAGYIILVGTKACLPKADRLVKALPDHGRVVNLAGATSIEELLALMTISNVLITNDSGTAHLASLTPIRQFVLFGPERPSVFRPLGKQVVVCYTNQPCSPCLSVLNHRTSLCTHNICLQSITPEEIYEKIVKETEMVGTSKKTS